METTVIKPSQPERTLTTPHAAAVAGIIAGVLFFVAQVEINLAIADLEAGTISPAGQADAQAVVFQLVGLAGIAFLWFIGVARDRLGRREDQFFATVLLGSGLLYLALTFVATALEAGLLSGYLKRDMAVSDPIAGFAGSVIYQVTFVFGFRMAAVFMLSSATMWLRTGVMPRWLAVLTGLCALVLLLTIRISTWITLIFPVWMVIVSTLILVINLRRPAQKLT